jgi:hypothetical protein
MGRFLADLDSLVPSEVAKNCVDVDMCAKHWNEPHSDALYGGADAPRHRTGRFATWAQEQILLCTLPDGPHLRPDGP